MLFEISDSDSQQNYRLLSGGVTPRPIAWISTCSADGVDNLAPYSFFTVASCHPPVLLYTQVTQRSGLDKDTLKNLIETGECVVNIVNSALLEKMNGTSANFQAQESEFELCGIESTPSHKVKPLSVKASPIRYECTLREILRISSLPAGGSAVFLDVKAVYVKDDLSQGGNINQSFIDSVGKMGGDYFSSTSDLIEIKRP